jgi:hypothetical protein
MIICDTRSQAFSILRCSNSSDWKGLLWLFISIKYDLTKLQIPEVMFQKRQEWNHYISDNVEPDVHSGGNLFQSRPIAGLSRQRYAWTTSVVPGKQSRTEPSNKTTSCPFLYDLTFIIAFVASFNTD